MSKQGGHHVAISDTRLWVDERGDGYPLIVLHGGPGLDHCMFGDYLDPLTDRYRLIFVDERAQGRSDRPPQNTWTLPRMAQDVVELAQAMDLDRYAVLGHSYGAFVALQNAVDFSGMAAQTIISSGIPSSSFLAHVDHNLATFEPLALRQQVAASWEREKSVQTPEDVASLLHDQMPFQFGDPLSPLIPAYERRTMGAVYSPDVLRHFSNEAYGGIEVLDRLPHVSQPTLVLAGRKDRTCSVEAAEAIAQGIPHAELMIFEHSGHMTFVEENELYLTTLRRFLDRFIG